VTGEWVDAESLQAIILGAIVALGLVAVLVLKLVRRLVRRILLVALIGALATSLWLQRSSLQNCMETCSCRLYGQEVAVPADVNPNCG